MNREYSKLNTICKYMKNIDHWLSAVIKEIQIKPTFTFHPSFRVVLIFFFKVKCGNVDYSLLMEKQVAQLIWKEETKQNKPKPKQTNKPNDKKKTKTWKWIYLVVQLYYSCIYPGASKLTSHRDACTPVLGVVLFTKLMNDTSQDV